GGPRLVAIPAMVDDDFPVGRAAVGGGRRRRGHFLRLVSRQAGRPPRPDPVAPLRVESLVPGPSSFVRRSSLVRPWSSVLGARTRDYGPGTDLGPGTKD